MERYTPHLRQRTHTAFASHVEVDMYRDPGGDWVRYADVPSAAAHEIALHNLRTAEFARDAAREAQDAAEANAEDCRDGLRRVRDQLTTAEAELRTARAELAARADRIDQLAGEAMHAGLERDKASDELAHLRAAWTALSNAFGGPGVPPLAAPPDAGWCYDMAAAPKPGAPQNDIELAFPGQKVRCGYRRIGETVWREPTSGERLNDYYGEPYAWRRAPAPPRPEAHQVPPVGSKL
jgi:hypothetical protein